MRFYYTPPLTLLRVLNPRNVAFMAAIGFIVFYSTINSVAQLIQNRGDDGLNPEPMIIDTPHPTVEKISKPTIVQELENIDNQKSWRRILILPGDNLSKVFSRIGLPNSTLHNIIKSNTTANNLTDIHPGQTIEFLLSSDEQLKSIKLPISAARTLHVVNTENGYRFNYEEKEILKKTAYKHGIINGSLYNSAIKIGLNNKLVAQLTDIFSWDIDFALDLRDGDVFKVLFEEEYIGDDKIDSGNIIAAEFKNQGRVYKAIRYVDNKGIAGYYSAEGYSLQKAFLRTPVKFTRISSHFSPARKHPISHQIRAHKGVDYAAPHGTPVKAAGDGKISFHGTKSGYGNTIEIQHGSKYSTLYAHLAGFSSNMRTGKTVRQGEVIGYVGKTGLATAEHLHYEFRVNGEHRNPLTVPLPRSMPIANEHRKNFLELAQEALDYMDDQHTIMLAKNASPG